MIIQFKIGNFRSFFQPQTLNFRATSLVSEDKTVDQCNIAVEGQDRILKGIGIYGANASGKSNLIKAIRFFKEMVDKSLISDEISSNGMSPYRLSTTSVDDAGFFEIIILLDRKKYRYGFTLNEIGDIASEWLYGPAEKNETFYFTRKSSKIIPNPIWFQEADDLPNEKLRSNALFLSFCASYDGQISSKIRDYVTQKIFVDLNFIRVPKFIDSPANRSTNYLIESGNKEIILDWLKDAGLPYGDVIIDKIKLTDKLSVDVVKLMKNIYDEKGNVQSNALMALEQDESEGTKKFYRYIGTLHDLFSKGGLFIADEIDSNFHPALLRKLIGLFNNPKRNNKNAQILFTSHDTNLMSPALMRRDQFYFTEKTLHEESILYSLANLRGIRNNADFARQYLAGLYGAMPMLGNYLECSGDA